MPSKNPQTLNNMMELTVSGGLPRDCITFAQASFRINPLVMNSTKLITTPANKPPKITRPRLVWATSILLDNAENDAGIMACFAAGCKYKHQKEKKTGGWSPSLKARNNKFAI